MSSTSSDVEVVIVGGGAAGIAAAKRLSEASIRSLVVEARPRLGGRAWTVIDGSGFALDLGCGWLHSANRNPWREIAEKLGLSIDTTPPPWTRPSLEIGFSRSEQNDFRKALESFFRRLSHAGERDSDLAAATLLEPSCQWNALINAISTYISGAELDRLSARDLDQYDDNGVNWRVVAGLGATVGGYGANLPSTLDCRVRKIDHRGKRLRIETTKGAIVADQVIVTVSSVLLVAEPALFMPALPEKSQAAAGLPLGVADKLFISLDHAEEFEKETALFGRTDRVATAVYHLRPFGRPQIEAYFGGKLASELETNGDGAFFDFAKSELVDLFGNDFARRLRPIHVHRWGLDPFSLGSYSFASPGSVDCRRRLAEPVDNRLFFAGEACSTRDFSTAHGAWQTGRDAADQVIAVREKSLAGRMHS